MKNRLDLFFRSLPTGAAVLLVLAWLAGAAPARAVEEATIIVPPEPSRVEKFAAAELARYLAAATGAKTTVSVGESRWTGGIVYWVGNLTGNGDRLAKGGFPMARLGDAKLSGEGVCIDGDARQVLLVGKGQRGSLNAVYTYLEEVIGCHWPEPERDYVPQISSWQPTPMRRVVNPQLAWRGFANHGRLSKENFVKIADWEAKNRMNSFQLFPAPYQETRDYIIDTVLDRGLLPNVGGHSRDYFLNGKKYLETNPEWFAIDQGKRTEQLNYRNFDSLPTYTRNVVDFLKMYPEIKIVSLWPNDGYGFDASPGPGENATDILLTYIDKLAEGIHAQVPGVQCEFLAYIIYTAAPLATKPVPCIIPTYCEHYGSFGARDHWHPIADDRYANKALREELKKWVAMSTQVTEFSYYGDDCIKAFLYRPLEDVMVADCRYYSGIGLAGNFFLFTNPESWWSNAPTAYAYARASWDKDATPEKISSDYYTSLYGPAAQAMQDHANALKALYELHPAKDDPLGRVGVGAIDIAGLDYETVVKEYGAAIAKANAALAKALPLATDNWTQERIAKLQSDTNYIDLWYQLLCGEKQLAKVKSAKLKAHLLELIDRALKTDVVAYDDARGYGSANAELKRSRDRIVAAVCDQP